MIKISDFDDLPRIDELNSKGIIKDSYLTDKFYKIYRMYNLYFLDYLDEKIGLKDIDDELLKSGSFSAVSIEKQDVYQRFSKYNYFYIRNNLAIDKLGDNYVDELIKRFDSNYYEYDDFAKEMIDKTYVDVCSVCELLGEISYGPIDSNFFAYANSIVLGCRFDGNLKSGDNPYEIFSKRKIFVEKIDWLNRNFGNSFEIPFKVIRYDDYSVKPVNDFTFAESKKKLK